MRVLFKLAAASVFAFGIGATGALDAASAASKKRPAPETQSLETKDVSWQARRERVYRDIERYDSAPMISGGGY